MEIDNSIDKIEEKKVLVKIVEASEEFLQSSAIELNYKKITDTILDISGAKYAAFNLYDEKGNRFTTLAISGPDGIIKKASSLLGFKLIGKEWEHYPILAQKIKSHTITHFSTASEYAEKLIPKSLALLIEKTLDIGELAYIKILKKNKMIGNFILVMPKNVRLKNENYIEIYTRLAGLFITRNISEAKLIESEEKYRMLIENSHDIIYTINTIKEVFTYVSPSITSILGYNVTQLIGKPYQRFIHPDDVAKCEAFLRKTIETGEKQSGIEYRLLHADGMWRWHTSNGVPLKDEAGTVVGFEGISSDITERKEMEAELLNKKAFTEAILESIPGMLYVYDDQGNFIDCNKKHEEMTGYSREELSHKNPLSWYDDESDIIRVKSAIKDIFIKGYGEVEASMRIKNGKILPMHFTGARLYMNGKGYFVGVGTDITKRKKVVEDLKESEEKFSKAFHTSPYAISITRLKDGKIIETNDTYESIFGFTKEESGASSTIGLGLWLDIKDRELLLSELKNGVEIKDREFRFRKKNGEIIICLLSSQIIHIKNKPFILTVINDITERKNYENKITYLSFHDYLTGAYNRRFLSEEIKRLDTIRQLPISIILGDLNNLKLINDTFGHNEGDRLLKETAELLKRICRSDDMLARWGGDEFVMLLPKTSIEVSEKIVQRIKKECKKLIFQKITLSISIGIATKLEISQDINEVIMQAESNMYKNKLVERESNSHSIISALEQALHEKSNETLEHTIRIKNYAIRLGKSIKLHSNQLDELSLLASLHDIGKVAISEKILLKEGKPTAQEWEIIKRHPDIGFNIAKASPQISHIAKYILACHENWDGSGYPQKLKGEEIPILSRIMFICDAYDVMTNKRSYKKAMSKNEAIEELKRCAGTQFDPVSVDKFIELFSK
jgi:diguanylate cyclase (GGDEF)-like protein/PAS domain S-box-containing protein